jgi:ABC-type nickel/cobalt efflux system permease component RcnA
MGALIARADTVASLLGNFTINQFSGMTVGIDAVTVHYAVVFGELPALRELHVADTNNDGVTSQTERDAYVGALAPALAKELQVTVDGVALPLHPTHWASSLPTEQGGFSLRLDVDFAAPLQMAGGSIHEMEFSNHNYAGRLGWHEIVVRANPGVSVFDTNAFSSSLTGGLTEALQSLPAAGPLDERAVHLKFTRGTAPPHARSLKSRPGIGATDETAPPGVAKKAGTRAGSEGDAEASSWIARETHNLVASISGPRLQPKVAILALLGALLLGAVHALSPGHGKTIVGAYLIGSRGTPRHAVFLGLTVTVTHTVGVFILGFATLYASRYIVPERLFPILSMLSALLVVGMGVVLLVQRAGAARHALSRTAADTTMVFHPVAAASTTSGQRALARMSGTILAPGHSDGTLHSHGGGPMHSHLPPGAAGEKITWRSLLALGISGGLVPCPSAMVLLLAAVALNKTAYGMLLVVAFSVGLALTLTAVGLAFLYARSRFRRPKAGARWPQLLPVVSAATITVVGIGLFIGSLRSFGIN